MVFVVVLCCWINIRNIVDSHAKAEEISTSIVGHGRFVMGRKGVEVGGGGRVVDG